MYNVLFKITLIIIIVFVNTSADAVGLPGNWINAENLFGSALLLNINIVTLLTE